MQLRETKKCKMARRYTMDEKILCLSLYKRSPKLYRYLSKLFTLPSKNTLTALLHSIPLTCGINECILSSLHPIVAKLKPEDRYINLLFDEISLMPQLQYNEASDKILGFEDFGNGDTKLRFADHALVFMIRGIKKNFKQPFCYTFCQATTKGATLISIIKEVIRSVRAIGFYIVATICDQGTANEYAIKSLISDTRAKYLREGKEFRQGTFEIDGISITPIFDVPHLMKGIRNNLLTKNLHYTMNGEEKIAKWEHVVEVYNQDVDEDAKLLPRLSDNHVYPAQMNKMKVKLCTQVFSHRVGAIMNFMAGKGIISANACDTGNLLLFFDKLFDSVNGNTDNAHDGKIYRVGIRSNSAHHKLWNDSIKILESMYFCDARNGKRSVPPSIKNWIPTIKGFQNIWDFLHKKKFSVLFPRSFNQDPLENYFGSIRSQGIRNINPTSIGFEGAFKTLLITNLTSSHSVGSNCEEDDSSGCLTVLRQLISAPTSVENFLQMDLEEEYEYARYTEIVELDKNSEVEENVETDTRTQTINYICGFILKKLRTVVADCICCESSLIAKTKTGLHNIIEAREYNSQRRLNYPSAAFAECINEIQKSIICMILKTGNNQGLKKRLFQNVISKSYFGFIVCTVHRKDLEKRIFTLCCKIFIHSYCKDITKILHGKKKIRNTSDYLKKNADTYYRTHSKHKK